MKKLIVSLFVLLLAGVLFASPLVNSRIIDPTSELYDYVDQLYSLNTMAKPETNRPWTEAQARKIMDDIDYGKQSGVALELYNKAMEIINQGQRWNISDDFGFSVNPILSLETYTHTNSDSFTTEKDWNRGFAQRNPWIKVDFEFSVGDNFWTISDIQFRKSRILENDYIESFINTGLAKQGSDGNYYVGSYVVTEDSYYAVSQKFFKDNFSTNFTLNTKNFDFISPHRAIVSVGGKNWNVSINRDRLKIGDSHIGNLLVDDYNDYNDYFNLSFFSKYFTYNFYTMFFNTLTMDSEENATEGRMFLIHTLDFRIWNRVNLKVSENVMYKYTNFDLQFLNPAFIYHNLNNRSMFNAIAYLEVNASLTKGLNLYVNYALDQARAPNEGDGQADASGFIAGLEYTNAYRDGVLESYFEIAKTTPLLYRRDKVDFIKASRYYHQYQTSEVTQGEDMGDGHVPVFEYIGFQFGGDTKAIKLGTKFTKPGEYDVAISGLLLEHGQMYIYTSHNEDGHNDGNANIKGKTPYGEVITRAMDLCLEANLSLDRFFKWPSATALLQYDLIAVSDFTKETKEYSNKRVDNQFTLGITVKL